MLPKGFHEGSFFLLLESMLLLLLLCFAIEMNITSINVDKICLSYHLFNKHTSDVIFNYNN